MEICEFCKVKTYTNWHHLIPRCQDGTETAETCPMCESFIHSTWSHLELREIYNTVEAIVVTEKYQKFLKWRLKQPPETIYKSSIGKYRNKNKYK